MTWRLRSATSGMLSAITGGRWRWRNCRRRRTGRRLPAPRWIALGDNRSDARGQGQVRAWVNEVRFRRFFGEVVLVRGDQHSGTGDPTGSEVGQRPVGLVHRVGLGGHVEPVPAGQLQKIAAVLPGVGVTLRSSRS